jgi:hypothetical protein
MYAVTAWLLAVGQPLLLFSVDDGVKAGRGWWLFVVLQVPSA